MRTITKRTSTAVDRCAEVAGDRACERGPEVRRVSEAKIVSGPTVLGLRGSAQIPSRRPRGKCLGTRLTCLLRFAAGYAWTRDITELHLNPPAWVSNRPDLHLVFSAGGVSTASRREECLQEGCECWERVCN